MASIWCLKMRARANRASIQTAFRAPEANQSSPSLAPRANPYLASQGPVLPMSHMEMAGTWEKGGAAQEKTVTAMRL